MNDIKISPANNLLLINKMRGGYPNHLRIQIYYYNPDSNSGGQIIRECLFIFSRELKVLLNSSKTPYEFMSLLSKEAYKTELLDKGTNGFDAILPILEQSFCGRMSKQSRDVLGTFDHYITIGTERTNDPEEYLLSIYAAFDKMRLFD